MLSLAGRADALCGQYSEALDMSDEARQFIADNLSEEVPYFVQFDEDRWRLGLAAVHVNSPLKCYSDEALNETVKATQLYLLRCSLTQP